MLNGELSTELIGLSKLFNGLVFIVLEKGLDFVGVVERESLHGYRRSICERVKRT